MITGSPRVAIAVGADTRYAEFSSYRPGAGTGGEGLLRFLYVVQASDRDDDGISIPANALSLNGGSIRDADGNDADLSHDAAPDNPEHKVNGSLNPTPTVTRIYIERHPAYTYVLEDTYALGENVYAWVEFSQQVTHTGQPSLVLQRRVKDWRRLAARRLVFADPMGASQGAAASPSPDADSKDSVSDSAPSIVSPEVRTA